MTRKDYIRIAEAITEARRSGDTINQVVLELCRVLAADNGQFDRERFMAACEGRKC